MIFQGGGGGQGPEGRVGGEIFENVCIKMAFFFGTLNVIVG